MNRKLNAHEQAFIADLKAVLEKHHCKLHIGDYYDGEERWSGYHAEVMSTDHDIDGRLRVYLDEDDLENLL